MAATVAARSCRYRWTRAAAAVRWQCCCRRSAEADAAENRAGRRRSATYARAVEGGSKAFTKHTPPKMQRALRIGDVMKRNRWLQEEKKKKREKKRLVSSTKQGVFLFFFFLHEAICYSSLRPLTVVLFSSWVECAC